ncbi:DNA mismatch repair protein msh3 [Calycina marina]|uniref:DNA mismatch repair protein n=1 Tax=Calycina marina TaxID=1763456 RepID=A0A9P7Z8J8_9HELO|nr:DNA mismatch repair protein msh3 [Calycina marina]
MGPSKPKPSQTKGQQFISSFFTPKSTINGRGPSQPTQSTLTARPKSPAPLIEEESIGDLSDTDTDDKEPVFRANGTAKRVLAEDVKGGTGVAERPAKRSKINVVKDDEIQSPIVAIDKLKLSQRTEKYLYASAGQAAGSILNEEDDATTKSKKAKLHEKFVKKLGHPDSIAHIKRLNWQITEETEALDEEDGEEGEEEAPPPRSKPKGAKTGKLTPMENQILAIKRKNMDTILIVEVGYKYRFYGEDARIAAKELGIVCIPGKFRYDEHTSEAHLDKFAGASFPTHRLSVHTKRLVQAGHKVGIVRQMETAALKKAGATRNTTFVRELTNVYTKGTYIEDIEGLDQPTDGPSGGAPASGFLLCITESKSNGHGTDEKVDVGILAVQPATGDIIYDTFEDGFMRNEIETRLLHIAPCEFLIVGELTQATEKLVQHLSGSKSNVFGDSIRVERVAKTKTMAAEAHSHVTNFYVDKVAKNQDSRNTKDQNLLDKVLNLEEAVTVCLSAMITHLTEYGLEHVFDLTKYFQSFSARSHMILNGNTLTNLEIYHNQTDHTTKGSLFWSLDKTQTKFGQRLLRKWVGRPLLDKDYLEERLSAVEELNNGHQTVKVDKLRYVLKSIKSDLERSLIRIYYGKCTRPELLTVMQTLQKLSNEYANATYETAGFTSPLINSAISSLAAIGDVVISFLGKINAEAAHDNDIYCFFREDDETDAITNHKIGILAVEHDLDLYRAEAAQKLNKPKVTYNTTAGIEYLIEVANTALKVVPASWLKISGTKKVSRFHTPEVVKMIRERDQHKESLTAACNKAFAQLLVEISAYYALFRDCISHLATLDCLLSLAAVASFPGYCKPTFISSANTTIAVQEARHPMVEQLISTYIPNSTTLSTTPGMTRALLITGPNMGGKSSYVRSLALLCIMAQIGSYVPATCATISLLDSIHVRMGASDNIFNNQSTFQVELSETSEILKTATPKSLVILDELGRGTSTHDGVAIAGSVLDYVVRETGCLCLFITHYQSLSSLAKAFTKNGDLKNVHMKFTAENISGEEGEEEITFLYEVGEGVAHRSYGLNVARLARVPKTVLDKAATKSRELELNVTQKKLIGIGNKIKYVMSEENAALDQLIAAIEQI